MIFVNSVVEDIMFLNGTHNGRS